MFDLAFLALRNTMRNKRRSAITIMSIAIGCAAMISFAGFITFTFDGLRETTIRTQLGHLQIYEKGFAEKHVSDPGSVLIKSPDPLERQLAEIDDVAVVTHRLSTSGLASAGGRALNVRMIGVDPVREQSFSDSEIVVEGRGLQPGDTEAGVIGEELRRGLGARIGDWITVLTTTLDGVVNTVDFRLVGVVRTGARSYDSVYVKVPVKLVQSVLQTDAVERIVILLHDTDALERVLPAIKDILAKYGGGYEIKLWHQLTDFYESVVRLYNGLFRIFTAIVAVVVMFSVANTMAMAVFERMGEIAALRAIGAGRGVIIRMIVLEGAFIGILGGAFGALLSWIIANVVHIIGGIPMPPPPAMSQGYQAFLTFQPATALQIGMLAVVVSCLSSIFPAVSASRVNILEALYK